MIGKPVSLLVSKVILLVFTGVLLVCALSISACSHVSYLWQAARGQLSLYSHERSFSEVLADPSVPQRVKDRIRLVGDIKSFVETELGVKPTANYKTYVQLKQPYVTYVLTVAERRALKERTWWFPIVGAFPYLGFFEEAEAKRWALRLDQEGYDTHVRGASAYSTLGYLRDPFLSSMISEQPSELANLIFHETTHAYIYPPGEGAFNEEVASLIGDYGERLYIQRKMSGDLGRWAEHREDRRRFGKMLRTFAEQLKAIYAAGSSPGAPQGIYDLLGEKEKAFARFRALLRADRRYSAWAASLTNNAVVLAHLTYEDDQDLFDGVFHLCKDSVRSSFLYLKNFVERGRLKNKNHDTNIRIQDELANYLKTSDCEL